jgi:hypothetical protein
MLETGVYSKVRDIVPNIKHKKEREDMLKKIERQEKPVRVQVPPPLPYAFRDTQTAFLYLLAEVANGLLSGCQTRSRVRQYEDGYEGSIVEVDTHDLADKAEEIAIVLWNRYKRIMKKEEAVDKLNKIAE